MPEGRGRLGGTLIQTLGKNWLLLALCGILDAVISVIYFVMRDANGPLTLHSWNGTIGFLGKLTLAAGACTIAAGLRRAAAGRSRLLVLNGLALVALGVIYYGFVRSRFGVSFNTIAFLIIVMAVSIGAIELSTGRTLLRRRHFADGWSLGMAGAVTVGFALVFLSLAFRWIRLDESHRELLWLGLYFGFTALCMLGSALRLHSLGLSQSAQMVA